MSSLLVNMNCSMDTFGDHHHIFLSCLSLKIKTIYKMKWLFLINEYFGSYADSTGFNVRVLSIWWIFDNIKNAGLQPFLANQIAHNKKSSLV